MYLTRLRRESYNLSQYTWTRGRQEFEGHGLLTVSRVRQGDDYRRLRNSCWIEKQRLLVPPL